MSRLNFKQEAKKIAKYILGESHAELESTIQEAMQQAYNLGVSDAIYCSNTPTKEKK